MTLELLMFYRVGPSTLRLLRTYWDQLTMVAKADGYFGHPFNGFQCVTQGDPLYPTIFNVVMDAIIHHWVRLVMPTEAGMGGLGLTIIDLPKYFYADYDLVTSTQPEKLQRAFDVLASLFDRFGLHKNTAKTFSMVCQLCHVPGRMSEEA